MNLVKVGLLVSAAMSGAMFSATIIAGGWSGQQAVGALKIKNNGHVFVGGATKPWNNPDGCTNADWLFIGSANPSYREKLAMLLAAKNGKSDVRLFTTGCVSVAGQTYGNVKEIEVK